MHVTNYHSMLLIICMLIAGDIHMNLGLPILENIRLATKYPRSVHNKSDSIIDLIISKKLYILDFTETMALICVRETGKSCVYTMKSGAS